MTSENTCQYCDVTLEDATKTTCEWCSQIIQEANCEGIYLIDTAVAVRKRDDLTTPETRRAEIQAKFDVFTGKA